MKRTIQIAFEKIIHDRTMVALTVITALVTVFLAAVTIFRLEPSEVQIVTHYTGFGLTNFYRDQWYYLISLVVFILIVGIVNIVVALKIHALKKRPLAIMYLSATLALLVLSSILIWSILRVATL